MAKTEVTLRETTSNAVQFQLLSGTAPINLSAVGTIQMFLRDRAGGTAGYTNLGGGKLAINGAAGGSVSWTPGSADVVQGSSPYNGYFKVFVTPTSHYFVPEDSEFTVHAREVF